MLFSDQPQITLASFLNPLDLSLTRQGDVHLPRHALSLPLLTELECQEDRGYLDDLVVSINALDSKTCM